MKETKVETGPLTTSFYSPEAEIENIKNLLNFLIHNSDYSNLEAVFNHFKVHIVQVPQVGADEIKELFSKFINNLKGLKDEYNNLAKQEQGSKLNDLKSHRMIKTKIAVLDFRRDYWTIFRKYGQLNPWSN